MRELIAFGLALMAEQEVQNEDMVERARKKYWDAVNLPRKMKKLERKHAKLDYSFAVYMRDSLSLPIN